MRFALGAGPAHPGASRDRPHGGEDRRQSRSRAAAAPNTPPQRALGPSVRNEFQCRSGKVHVKRNAFFDG